MLGTYIHQTVRPKPSSKLAWRRKKRKMKSLKGKKRKSLKRRRRMRKTKIVKR